MRRLGLFFLAFVFFSALNAAHVEVNSCANILNYIKENLPQCGILKSTGEFVYLDIDDAYVHQLLPFIKKEGFEEPPYFGEPGLVGAHISVFYPDEVKKYKLGGISECGEKICFTLKQCLVVYPPHWQEVEEVYVINVDSPELDQIRKKYRLPKREHDFHITIGVKPKAAKAA